MKTDITKFLAKSDGTTLIQHTEAVVNYSLALFDRCTIINDKNNELRKACLMAAALHDIGKLTDNFQSKLNSEEYLASEAHNIVSWAFTKCSFEYNKSLKLAAYTVLYHHVPENPENIDDVTAFDIYSKLNDIEILRMREYYDYMRELYPDLPCLNDEIDENTDGYPSVKLFNLSQSSTSKAEEELLIRSIVVKADRDISSGKYDNERIAANDDEYMTSIFNQADRLSVDISYDKAYQTFKEKGYDMDRLQKQINIVDEGLTSLSDGVHNTVQINASAGFGKTIVGLLSVFKRGKKAIWCVPTREIAISTYNSIWLELSKLDIPISLALYYGNQLQDSYNSESKAIDEYDIVVSVIDSMLSRLTNNNTGNLLYGLLTMDVIFDEYHNVVTDKALFAAASLIWKERINRMNSYSMFLSATPLDLHFAGIKDTQSFVHSISPDKYKGDIKIDFKYKKINDLADDFPEILPNSFVITNTVQQSIRITRFLEKRMPDTEILLYHSLFLEEDRNNKRKILFNNFGKMAKYCNEQEPNMIVVCTGIIGTGLDISARNIYDFTLSPADTLQRVCGRASRFGEYDEITYTLLDVADDEPEIGKGNKALIIGGKDGNNKPLNDGAFDYGIRRKYIDELKIIDGSTITKDELYAITEEFNEDEKLAYKKYYDAKMSQSIGYLSNITLKKASGKPKTKGNERTSKETSFRGDGTDIFIAVPYANDSTKYAVLTMSSNRAWQIEKTPDEIEARKIRWNYYRDNLDKKQLNVMKYWNKIKDAISCNFNICIDIAHSIKTPLPLKNARYTSKYGMKILKEQ